MDHWIKRCREVNEKTIHDRGLYRHGGYQLILDFDFMKFASEQLENKDYLRVLDIGCGNGQAMSDLEVELSKEGLSGRVHFSGIGINLYNEMKIRDFTLTTPEKFYVDDKDRFDLIVSVYCFHYIPDKLSAMKHIYNNLLADKGIARINMPCDLIRIDEERTNQVPNSADDAERFQSFLDECVSGSKVGYDVAFTEENDFGYRCEFGSVKMQRDDRNDLAFRTRLQDVAMLDSQYQKFLISFYERL